MSPSGHTDQGDEQIVVHKETGIGSALVSARSDWDFPCLRRVSDLYSVLMWSKSRSLPRTLTQLNGRIDKAPHYLAPSISFEDLHPQHIHIRARMRVLAGADSCSCFELGPFRSLERQSDQLPDKLT